eukprot:267485_1
MLNSSGDDPLQIQLLSESQSYDRDSSGIQIEHNVSDNKDSRCKLFIKILWKMTSIALSFTMIATIVSELLLLINVYSSNTGFFVLSTLFLVVPLAMVSCTVCVCSWFNAINPNMDRVDYNLLHCLMCIPIINIPLVSTYAKISTHVSQEHLAHLALIDALLSGMMTFPLYIINLSFLLESVQKYSDIEPFNIAQLIISLISFVLNPIKLSLSTTQTDYGRGNMNISTKIKVLLCATFTFGPIVLIEVIHFFPFCFAHYVDHTLNSTDLLIILLVMFTAPKLIFVYDVLKKQWQNSDEVQYHICEKILFSIVPFIIFVTIPLVPYIILMYNEKDDSKIKKKEKDNSINCYSRLDAYYWKLIIYLLLSYGGSCVYVIIKYPFHLLSQQVIYSIACIMMLIFVIAVTFPMAFYLMKKNNIKFFESIEYTSFGLQMDKL